MGPDDVPSERPWTETTTISIGWKKAPGPVHVLERPPGLGAEELVTTTRYKTRRVRYVIVNVIVIVSGQGLC